MSYQSEYSNEYQRYRPGSRKDYYPVERDILQRGYYQTGVSGSGYNGSTYLFDESKLESEVEAYFKETTNKIRWTEPSKFGLSLSSASVELNETNIGNHLNDIFVIHSGLNPVDVVAIVHSDGAGMKTAASETLHAAYSLIMGSDFPFREVNPVSAFDQIFGNHAYTALVIGTRLPDQKKHVVRTYVYSSVPDVRVNLAKVKSTWDNILPIILVDPKDASIDLAGNCISSSAWLCQLNESFKGFLKTLRAPAEDNQAAIFPYFINKLVRTTKASRNIYVKDTCNPCPEKPTFKKLNVTDSDLQFLSEHAFLYLLCFLAKASTTASESLTSESINKFGICGFSSTPVEIQSIQNITSSNIMEQYRRRITSTLKLLKIILTKAFGNDENLKCMGILYCALQEVIAHIDKVVDETSGATVDLFFLTSLRSKYMTITSKIVEFYTVLQDAITKMSLPMTVTKIVNEGFCRLTTKLVPWYHQRSQDIESLYNAAKLLHEKREGCFPRVMIPSPVIVREKLRFELLEHIPSLFEKNNEPDDAALITYMQKHSGSPLSSTVRNYLSLKMSMEMQKKRADLDITMSEACKTDAELCDLLEFYARRCAITDNTKLSLVSLVKRALTEHQEHAGKTPGEVTERALAKRKTLDQNLRKQCMKVLALQRQCQEITSEMVMMLGVNPIGDEALSKKNPELLKGLAALMAIRDSGFDDSLMCNISKSLRSGETVTNTALDIISNASNVYKKLPSIPGHRDAFLDSCAYPYSQSAILGAVDGEWYVPYFGPELQPGYWRVDVPSPKV